MNVRQLVNKWVILGALAFAGLLILITAIAIGLTWLRLNLGRWVCSRRCDRDRRAQRHLRRAAHTDH